MLKLKNHCFHVFPLRTICNNLFTVLNRHLKKLVRSSENFTYFLLKIIRSVERLEWSEFSQRVLFVELKITKLSIYLSIDFSQFLSIYLSQTVHYLSIYLSITVL